MTTWGKIHGSITWHAKALAAGDAALGVWVRLLGHCAQHLTDGFVTTPVALAVGSSSPGAVDALVRAGLLESVEGGYQLHDYLDHNASKADIEASRSAARDRKSRSRLAAKAMQSRVTSAVTDGVTARVTDGVSHGVRPFAGEREIEREEEKKEMSKPSIAPSVLALEPATGAIAPPSASAGGLVRELFEHWQHVHKHPTAKLDAKRRSAIERAIKSHGADVVRAAIDGCALSPFHKGQNDRRAIYDDLTLILRDASKIESFAALATREKEKSRQVEARTTSKTKDEFASSPFPAEIYSRKKAVS